MAGKRGVAWACLAVVALAVGCDGPVPDETIRPQWRSVVLPAPPGEPGRLMLRDATTCDGRWYAVGAVITPAGETRPAAWRSDDAQTWSSITLRPTSYYGIRNILYAVGCYAGRIAVIGAKVGGAHGNPRVRTWRQLPDGSLAEVSAEFLVYGGPAAVNVSRIAGGPKGWLIAGGRESGAAAWRSADASAFQIVEGAPNLASGGGVATAATDVVAVPEGWVIGGSGRAAGRADRDPLVWTSPDGLTWARVALPATGDDEAVQRLVRTGSGLLALGVRGSSFAAWRLDGGAWREAGRFGGTGTGAVAGVESAAVSGDRVLAMTVSAEGHRLWSGVVGGLVWTAVTPPMTVPVGGYTAGSTAASGHRALVIADDGTTSGAWITDFPGAG